MAAIARKFVTFRLANVVWGSQPYPRCAYGLHAGLQATWVHVIDTFVARQLRLLHHGSKFGVRHFGACPQAWAVSADSVGFQTGPAHEEPRYSRTGTIVKTLIEDDSKLPTIAQAAERPRWEAIRFGPIPPPEAVSATADALGLQPRDVNLFAAQPQGMSNQRASLMPRGRAILFKTEVVRALIRSSSVFLFPCKREKDTLRVARAVQASLYHNVTGMPFEMRALEALLAETVWQFERRYRQLKMLADGMEEEVSHMLRFSSESATIELQRLLPIQKALTEMQHDVREARQAVQEVVDTDKLLRGICLTESSAREAVLAAKPEPTHPILQAGPRERDERADAEPDQARAGDRLPHAITPHMRLAAGLLEPYERQIHSVEGGLKEMQENMDVVRDVWSMQLAAARNRMMRINMLVTIASFSSAMACMVPASFMGMNVLNGLEESSQVFWPIVYTGIGGSLVLFMIMWAYWRYWPNYQHQQRVTDMRALRDLLLNHLDDLEDILEAVRERARQGPGLVSRKEFQQLVEEAVSGVPLNKDEVDVLYRVFDVNHDNFLELGELIRAHDAIKLDDSLPPQLGPVEVSPDAPQPLPHK
eukprot:jgi/Botrbrau1/6284/Bobra.0129s0029.1